MAGQGVVSQVAPAPDARLVLDRAHFIDCYRVKLGKSGLDAAGAARRMFERPPDWATRLMRLRDAIVAPLGLKTARRAKVAGQPAIGMFPIVAASPGRVVLGFPDKHLDFRVVVDVAPVADGGEVRVTTLVRVHNPLGRLYLASILPFHRRIVRAMLKSLAGDMSDNVAG